MQQVKVSQVEGINQQRQRCEIYSRVVGYIRPVAQWNKGKKAEWRSRKTFLEDSTTCSCSL